MRKIFILLYFFLLSLSLDSFERVDFCQHNDLLTYETISSNFSANLDRVYRHKDFFQFISFEKIELDLNHLAARFFLLSSIVFFLFHYQLIFLRPLRAIPPPHF